MPLLKSFPFGEMAPDAGTLNSDGRLHDALNCRHTPNGYVGLFNDATMTGAATFTSIVDPVAIGDKQSKALALYDDGTNVALDVFNVSGGAIADTVKDVAYTTPATINSLSVAEHDSEVAVCAHISDGAGDLSYTGYFTYTGDYTSPSYTDLSGTFIARICGRVGQFMMFGNIPAATDGEYLVRWSAIGDATDYPIPGTDDALSKQAGQEYLRPEFGEITGITGDEFYGYVFQERAVTKFTYVGGGVVFRVETFEEGRGATAINAFERVENDVFFASQQGRHLLRGGQIADIGYGRVDDTYPTTGFSSNNIVSNPAMGLVHFETGNLLYNYKTDRFTRRLFGAPVWSVDSATNVLGSFNSSKASETLLATGTALAIGLVSDDYNFNPGGRAVVSGVRVLGNNLNPDANTAITVAVRDSLGDSVSYGSNTQPNSRTDMANFRAEGRYHRIKYVGTTDHGETDTDGIFGIEIEYYPQGRF